MDAGGVHLWSKSDTTSIAKEGQFADLDGWIHSLNRVRGLHVVMLYICCGDLRLPWRFRIWRGKGTPSAQDLALQLVRQLLKEVLTRSRQAHFLGDAGFSSVKLLDALGLTFTVGMRADRQMTSGKKIREVTSQERHIELAELEGMELWLYWVWLPRAGEPLQRFVITNRRRTSKTVRKTGRRRWKLKPCSKP